MKATSAKYMVHDDEGSSKGIGSSADDSIFRKSTRRLRESYEEHRKALVVGNLEREQPFSWQYCLMALVSYALLLSDVVRTGLAIDKLTYRSLELENLVLIGPFGYVTYHLTTANATQAAMTKYWPYKYDSTSISMRAVAEHLGLQAWSPCLLYKERCDETNGLPLAQVFTMIEQVVEGVAMHPGSQSDRRSGSTGILTLRTKSEFKDRVHHYALPWFFETPIRRTVLAVHYPHEEISGNVTRQICGAAGSSRRPYSCSQAWTNFKRLDCGRGVMDDACRASAPRIWEDIALRQAELMRVYPNHTLDFVIIDAMEDYQRGSLSYQGTKYFEVAVFTRIRKCESPSSCTTVAVEDHRYEAGTFVMNVLDWHACVAVLRMVGQIYVWIRVSSLAVGCWIARKREPRFQDATFVSLFAVTIRTFFLIPSQVIIYGSSFPISCYLVAHLIDSPAAYALVEAYFTSVLGQMHWNWGDFIQHCAVSMRTVWVVGFICHRVVMLSTNSNWSPIHGVPGTAEFSITFIASLTIFAQFRTLSFRSTRVLAIHEVIGSARRTRRQAETTDSVHTMFNNLVSGSPVDFKCLMCGFLGLCAIAMFVWLLKLAFPRLMSLRLTLTSSTITPYSAGTLWPRSRLVVSWYGTVLSFDSDASRHKKAQRVNVKPIQKRLKMAYNSIRRARDTYRGLLDIPDKSLVIRETTVSMLLQREMHSVGKRTREIESTVYLINLAVMTDPFSLLILRVFEGRLVGLYQTKATKRCFLLPYGLLAMDADIPIEWDTLELIAVVNSKDLQWPDLLRCG